MKTTISILLLATLALTAVHCQVEEVVNENGNNPNACATVMCAFGYRCIESPKRCFTTPCPQHDCVPVEENKSGQNGQVDPQVRQADEQTGQAYGSRCVAVMCAWGYRCVEKPNNQFECVKREANDAGQGNRPTSSRPVLDNGLPDPCDPNPCPEGKRCFNFPKFCIRAPCPQYGCTDIY